MNDVSFRLTHDTLANLPIYPNCESCGELIFQEDGFVAVAAVRAGEEHKGGICGECCSGNKDTAMNLFIMSFMFRPKQ